MYNSGFAFYDRYRDLVRQMTPFIRASRQDRVIESAQKFSQGLHEAKLRDQVSDGDYPYPILTISESPGSNNTLVPTLPPTPLKLKLALASTTTSVPPLKLLHATPPSPPLHKQPSSPHSCPRLQPAFPNLLALTFPSPTLFPFSISALIPSYLLSIPAHSVLSLVLPISYPMTTTNLWGNTMASALAIPWVQPKVSGLSTSSSLASLHPRSKTPQASIAHWIRNPLLFLWTVMRTWT